MASSGRGGAAAERVPPGPVALRIDKWLWAARFYRTRSLATRAIEAGQVRVAGERVKPAHALRGGEIVGVRKAGIVFEVEVTGLADRRGNAAAASALYRETPAGAAAREAAIAQHRAAAAAQPRFPGRPTKRDRRALEDFLNEP